MGNKIYSIVKNKRIYFLKEEKHDTHLTAAEIAKFAKSGPDIIIKNNWLEQPPGLLDREKLAKNKEK